ncbi:unnamed protein product [Coffea canephora]|uniref:FLZ-type domain-containing protein n=2 Tax=Coffea TaxID=13442 RepID=A0A068TS98_COFCA|nr:FCS-Like Zinc finger 15 isoform X2 [Coffea arabica]XP_027120266.1 FCS-Like Zinc finger 15-like isoform X2 [Coffea arabica]CDO98844.1 unnamed protein product [Coffea canephora]
MVGLSVVLEAEGYEDISSKRSAHHQVISKASMIIKPSPSSPTPPTSPSPFTKRNSSFNLSCGTSGFLDYCFLCRQKLLPGKDIYMYKGDRAFCSEECRCRQIFMDEEETIKAKTDHCSLAASSSNSSSRKGAKKRANGFAY